MVRRRGSWPPLLVATAVFLALFGWQRSHSTILQVEQERDQARALAEQVGAADEVSVADVLALRDMVGLDAEIADWARLTSDFASYVQAARRDHEELPGAVLVAIRALATDEVAVRRFLVLRERFAAGS